MNVRLKNQKLKSTYLKEESIQIRMSRTESPSVKDIDINMDKSDSTCFSKQTLEEENAILRKQVSNFEYSEQKK